MSEKDRHPSPSLTLQDLAQTLGVSRTTVSNAFNRPDQLSPQLRDKILTTAQEMGYPGPNPMARQLRTGRTGAIGLVFSEPLPYAFNDPTAIAFLQGVARVCEQVQESLLIMPAVDDEVAQKTVQGAAVDGFIIYCLPTDSPVISRVLERRLPVVAVDQHNLQGVPSVGIDDRLGAYQAAVHLLGLGHTRLAVLAVEFRSDHPVGPVEDERRTPIPFAITARRLLGYEDALREAGLDPLTLAVETCPGNREDVAFEATRKLLAREFRPTGILAMSDRLAIGALHAAEQWGLQVPEDLSIVGFDDIPLATQIQPSLTTVHQPLVEKGVAAAELLLLDSGQKGFRRLETRLIVRESSGPAPSNTDP